MKIIPAYKCICQDCNIVFNINATMVNVINIEEDIDIAIKFFTSSLNRITCPHCGANFTYEIPMLIYSVKNSFAIKVDPYSAANNDAQDTLLPEFFKAFSFIYRQVTYHIEALEKCRIFQDGLDDKFIEYVKLRFFSDADATPMEDINLCYKSSDNQNIYFEKLDYNGKLIKEYCVSRFDINPCKFKTLTKHPTWQQINRYTIEKYINKEEI